MKLARKGLWLSIFLLFIFAGSLSVSNLLFAEQPGWTKAQVENELGKPTSITIEAGMETWIYNKTPKQKTNVLGGHIGRTLIGSVVGMVIPSYATAGALANMAVTETAVGLAQPKQNTTTSTSTIIRFGTDGRVIGKPVANVPTYNTANNQSAVGKNVSGTGGNVEVYTLPKNREFHFSGCSILDNAKRLIIFPSAETAKSSGAVPHSCVK